MGGGGGYRTNKSEESSLVIIEELYFGLSTSFGISANKSLIYSDILSEALSAFDIMPEPAFVEFVK